MHPRLFRLTERHQRIDELLRTAEGRSYNGRFELQRLQVLRAKAKHLIHQFTARDASA